MSQSERGEESREISILFAVAIMVVLAAGAYLIVNLRHRVQSLESALGRQTMETQVIEDKLHLSNQNMETAVQELGSKVGMTQEELARRTAELKAQQQAAARLAAAQQATSRQVQAVNTVVSGVRSRLGGDIASTRDDLNSTRNDLASTRNDLDSTRNDLANTNAKFDSAIGDLNQHIEMIARNHNELEVLKHKDDRAYYEFTLHKNDRTVLSTISVELKKTDPARSRYSLRIYADDRVYEKKDRALGEPLQFYTGRDRKLYELVIFNASGDDVTGYLSTPK